MDRGIWALAAALGIAVETLSVPASAAPALASTAGGMKAAPAETSPVQQARWHHHCWYDRWGHRHCRRPWGYGPGAGFFSGSDRYHHGYRGHGYRGHHR